MEDENPQKQIRWTMKSNSEIAFGGLSKPEAEAMEGALLGANWVRVKDGRLQIAHALETAPPPERDKEVGPFWPSDSGFKPHKNVKMYRAGEPEFSDPHLLISALSAGSRDKDGYQKNADKMESYGFECLRSRRGVDGRYWEIWYLPSLFLAEGQLGRAIGEVAGRGEKDFNKKRLDAAVQFLCRNVNFGSLDAGIQRAALTYD